MLTTYSYPQKIISQFSGVLNGTPQEFDIALLGSEQLWEAATLLTTVQAQLAKVGQGSLLKTRTVAELQKYYAQNAVFLGAYNKFGLQAISMVAPVTNFAELGRVDTQPNLAELPFNGLSEDVIDLHNPSTQQTAKPEDFCVFGAMAINQDYAQLGIAQKLWPHRLKAALEMEKAFACTTISATNDKVLKHFINNHWLMDESKTIIENGKEITLHRFIAPQEVLEKNLTHAKSLKNPQPAMAVYA